MLLIFILITKLFPTFQIDRNREFTPPSDDFLTLDLIEITQQSSSPPIPQRPRVSLEISDADPVDDPDFDLYLDIQTNLVSEPVPMPGTGSTVGPVVSNPQTPPRVTRIVEPITPPNVLNSDIRVRVSVTFLVNTDGTVDEYSVTQLQIFNRSTGQFETVDSVGDNIIEATLYAAEQWRFRAAMQDGTPVRAYSTHIFSFGR
ncbi:MAG: energy transducer TonB [Balneolales bacterium]|nr:energy transducer TonB [Balneolales bacterium]